MKNIFDEISFLYARFDQAEREWLNRFDDLEGHYQTAINDFSKYVPKGTTPGMGAGEAVEIGSSIILGAAGLSGTPAVMAVPIVLGLKKLATLVDTSIQPPPPDVATMKNKIGDIKKTFRDATEHLGKEIVKLMEKAKDLAGGPVGTEITDAISKLLISPIWYPPATVVTRNPGLAGAFEMRMWFRYVKELLKMPPGALLPAGVHFGRIDYTPMWERMQHKNLPPNIEYTKMVIFNKLKWMPKGNHFDFLESLKAYGEKHRELKLQHSYPPEVKSYIARTDNSGFATFARALFTGQTVNDMEVPPSGLTGANVTF
jgi:hypothetical protein